MDVAQCCSFCSNSSNSALAARATVQDAFSNGDGQSLLGPLRCAGQLGDHEHLEQFQGLVDCFRLQVPHRGVPIALRLASTVRSSSGAFEPSVYRAGAATQFGGICDSRSWFS